MLVSTFTPVSQLLPHVEPELETKTVAFIPTAGKAMVYSSAGRLTELALRRIGVNVCNLDIAGASYGFIRDAIENSDIIYVGGGNSFFLLQEMRRSGADAIIAEAVANGKPYIGESAGAVVAGPDIGYIQDMDDAKAAPMLHDSRGLGLVDFRVVPHYQGPFLGRRAAKIVRRYADASDLRIITDRQAIVVHDGKDTTISL